MIQTTGKTTVDNRTKPCYQYDLQGNFIRKWDRIIDAANSLGVTPWAINRNMHTTHYSAGYYWFSEDMGTTITPPGIKKAKFIYDVVTSGKKMYKTFCKQFPSVELTYEQYSQAIEEINSYYREHLLETGHVVFLPFGNGKMMVQKNKIKVRVDKNGNPIRTASIHWPLTRQLGDYIYILNEHSDGYNYRYMWFANSSYIEPSNIWKMEMTNESCDLLRDYVHNKQFNYRNLYRECFSRSTNIEVVKKMNQLKQAHV